MAGTVPQTTLDTERSQQFGVTSNYASFQGFTTGTQVSSLTRGSGFTVAHTATGVYTVTLQFVPGDAVTGSPTNNQGLLQEPTAYVVSETAATAPASVFVIVCTRVAAAGTFQIQTRVAGSLADVTSADRVFFNYTWINTSYVP